MTLGGFTIDLDPDTPWAVRRLIVEGGYLIVTPGWSPGAPTKSELLDASRFTGQILTIDDRRMTLEGPSIAVLLGDHEHKGDTYTSSTTLVTGGAGGFDDMIDALLLRGNGITVGTVVSTRAFANTAKARRGWTPRRILLDGAGSLFPAGDEEHRVNANGTLDADDPATLFRSGEVIIGRGLEGRDLAVTVIPAELRGRRDIEDWTSGVYYYDTSDTTAGTWSNPTLPYVGLDGSSLKRRLVVEDSDVDDEDEAAERVGTARDGVRRTLNVYADPSVDVRRYVEPGDSIYLHDPENGFVDLTSPVDVLGGTVGAELVRVVAIESPFRPGQGAWYVAADDSVVDLTRYTIPDPDGPVRLEIGAPNRALNVL